MFGATLTELVNLSLHQYGHAFVLQILSVATTEQLGVFAMALSSHVKLLTLDLHGCRVIQKALQVLPHDSREQLIEGLKSCPAQCIKNMHGNHVMQVCIEKMPSASIAFIIHAIEGWGADSASAHLYACRVVMRLLEHAQRWQMQDVLHQIFQSVPKLVQNRYGNYVLQHILEHSEATDRRQLISLVLCCGVTMLAKQKYAHNVVLKCIVVAWLPEFEATLEAERVSLSQEFVWQEEASGISMLGSDRFGGLVLECLLDHLKGPDLEKLEQLLCERCLQ